MEIINYGNTGDIIEGNQTNIVINNPKKEKFDCNEAKKYAKAKDIEDLKSYLRETICDDGWWYFYKAVSMFEGKNIFDQDTSIVNEAIRYIDKAINVMPDCALFYYFKYIVYEKHFKRKHGDSGYKYDQTYPVLLEKAMSLGLEKRDELYLRDIITY